MNEELRLAVMSSNMEEVKRLLDAGADVNARDKHGMTLLHLLFCTKHFDVARLLIERGADVNAKDNRGRTPLHMAAGWANDDMGKLLVYSGADEFEKDNHGCTPLEEARSGRSTDFWAKLIGTIIAVLIIGGVVVGRHMSDMQERQSTPRYATVHDAAGMGDLEDVRRHLETGTYVDTREELTGFHCTPLHIAAVYGQMDVAMLLIEQGAEVNARAKNGLTPLHMALTRGSPLEYTRRTACRLFGS